jgi:hypothetical protein
MPPSLTLTPNVATFIQGDSPITVSLSGGNTTTGPGYFWESNSGTFGDRFIASTSFTPNNATNITSIIGRRVQHAEVMGTANVSPYGTIGAIKLTGSTTAWDSYVTLAALPSLNGFYEIEPVETVAEKAMGFLSNTTYADPTLTNANVNLTFGVSWHMLGNGTAIPRRAGVAVANPVIYKAGDRFRITVQPTKVLYSLNGIVIATIAAISLSAWYPTSSIKTVNGVINNPTYFNDTTNVASATISVSGLFPVEPNYTFERDEDNNTLVSVAEDGSSIFRKKGDIKKSLSLQFNERPYTEYALINDFWKAHEKHNQFIFRDLTMSDSYIMRFDAGLRINVQGPDSVTIQVSLKEV